jgi:hypothetical protein
VSGAGAPADPATVTPNPTSRDDADATRQVRQASPRRRREQVRLIGQAAAALGVTQRADVATYGYAASTARAVLEQHAQPTGVAS